MADSREIASDITYLEIEPNDQREIASDLAYLEIEPNDQRLIASTIVYIEYSATQSGTTPTAGAGSACGGPEYRVTLEDFNGNPVAYIKDFISLSVTAVWAGKGNYQLTMSGFDDRIDRFVPDYQIRVSLLDPSNEINTWVDIFSGFIKTNVKSLSNNGQRTFQSFGPSLEELLAKEDILWYAGSAQASKSGIVASVMAEYVKENIGVLALQTGGRDVDGIVTGLTTLSDGTGPSWTGERSRKNLLQVLEDLRAFSIGQNDQVDFRIVSSGAYTWEFQAGKLGADRTTRGLDPTTGLNAAGNVPVVFSEAHRNIENFTRSYNSANAYNQITALGKGEGAGRIVAVSQDNASIVSSPIARRNKITTSNTDDPAKLLDAAEGVLAQSKPRDSFSFEPRDSRSVFNRDYFLGDFITAQDGADEFHKQVVSVTYAINNGTTVIVTRNIEFADV